jgi:acyl-CoA synthetase (AMP-forming)/AMP-acid ligase II
MCGRERASVDVRRASVVVPLGRPGAGQHRRRGGRRRPRDAPAILVTDGREIVIAPCMAGSELLVTELQQLVRSRLALYEVPRSIDFVDELPLTATGEIRCSEFRRREAERPGPPG